MKIGVEFMDSIFLNTDAKSEILALVFFEKKAVVISLYFTSGRTRGIILQLVFINDNFPIIK